MLKSFIVGGTTIFLILAFLFFVQVQELTGTVKLLNLLNTFIVAAFFALQGKFFRNTVQKKALILVLILIISYIFSAISVSGKLDMSVNSEPVDEGYVSDEKDFLKTFYIMKSGENYYQSFGSALINDARFTKIPFDLYSWRLPTAFYIWKFLAEDGRGIINLFIIFSAISLLAAFFITKKFVDSAFAVFSPMALVPYFLNAISGTSFLFIEWWALFPFLLGLVLVFYKRMPIGIGFLILSFFIRELLVIPVLAILLVFFFKSKKLAPFLIILGGFLIFMIVHKFLIEVNYKNVVSYSVREIHMFDKGFLLHILAFSTQFYTLAWLRIGTLFTILAAVGFLVTSALFWDKKDKSLLMIAAASFMPLFLISPFISTSADGFYSDYWAIIIMPVLIIFSPLIFNVIPLLKTRLNFK